jgi:hypothetical protein
MATLHVRNVPEPLYQLLRRQAEQNGRSIGAEAISMIEHQVAFQAVQRRPGPLGRLGRAAPGAQRFSSNARAAVVEAQNAARELHNDHVGTGHLLLGLLRAEGGARLALETLGVDEEHVRAELEERVPAAERTPARLPFGPDAKQALELALRESLTLRHTAIGTEHVLLGIAGADGVGAELVRAVEPDAARVRGCVLRAIGEAAAGPFFTMTRDVPAFRVVELEGSPSEWEARLNEAAEDGYELAEIVGSRAIFRC